MGNTTDKKTHAEHSPETAELLSLFGCSRNPSSEAAQSLFAQHSPE